MPGPSVIDPSQPVIPEEWRRRYERRTAAELATDVTKLFEWKRIAEIEKNRMQAEIIALERDSNFRTLCSFLTLFDLLGDPGTAQLCGLWAVVGIRAYS